VKLEECEPPLISTKRGAITVASVAGFLCVLSIRSLFLYASHNAETQFQPPFPSDFLSNWAVVIVSASLYACLIALYITARDWERIVVAGWFADVLLGPSKIGLPAAGAVAIRFLQTAAVGVALLAALVLVQKPYSQPLEGDVAARKPTSLTFYVFIFILPLLGMSAYFVLQLP